MKLDSIPIIDEFFAPLEKYGFGEYLILNEELKPECIVRFLTRVQSWVFDGTEPGSYILFLKHCDKRGQLRNNVSRQFIKMFNQLAGIHKTIFVGSVGSGVKKHTCHDNFEFGFIPKELVDDDSVITIGAVSHGYYANISAQMIEERRALFNPIPPKYI